MDKKALAVAVAALFAAPAFAQSSNVVLYGRANLGIDQYSGNGATTSSQNMKSRYRIFDSSSRLGVRGVEQLGGGLRAIFQIESGLNADNGTVNGQAGTANTSSGILASRPSWVGLEGGFGRVQVGRQDVYWGNGTIDQTGANYINTSLPWTSGGNTGRVNLGIARQSNVLSYTTPQLGPVNASLFYSPDTGAAPFVNAESVQGGLNTNARLYAATVRGAFGPVLAQIDYATKQTSSDAVAYGRPKNTGIKGAVGFTYKPGAQISLVVSRVTTNDNGAAEADYKRTNWHLNWEHLFGNFQALAQFGMQSKVSGCGSAALQSAWCDNSKVRGWLLSGRYLASKRTALYVTYTQVRNDANAFTDYTGGAYTSTTAAQQQLSKGFDPRVIGVGVIHNF